MKYIHLLILIMALSACKKDTDNNSQNPPAQTPPPPYNNSKADPVSDNLKAKADSYAGRHGMTVTYVKDSLYFSKTVMAPVPIDSGEIEDTIWHYAHDIVYTVYKERKKIRDPKIGQNIDAFSFDAAYNNGNGSPYSDLQWIAGILILDATVMMNGYNPFSVELIFTDTSGGVLGRFKKSFYPTDRRNFPE